MYLIWKNKCYLIYIQQISSKFMNVNSSITPLKIATVLPKNIENKKFLLNTLMSSRSSTSLSNHWSIYFHHRIHKIWTTEVQMISFYTNELIRTWIKVKQYKGMFTLGVTSTFNRMRYSFQTRFIMLKPFITPCVNIL